MMIAIVLFAALLFLFLSLLLARYARSPRLLLSERGTPLFGRGPRITPERFAELCDELMSAMGIELTPIAGEATRLLGHRADPFHRMDYVVFLEASPPADLVEQSTLLELAATVRSQNAPVGILMTPYEVDVRGLAGFEVDLELCDGERVRDLFATWLPSRLAEIDRYRGFGKRVTVPARPLAPAPGA